MKNPDEKTKEQLFKEIDQLKTRVSEQEESKIKNQLLLENSPVCTKIVDLDFNLQYMSSSGIRELKIDDITEYYGKPYPLDFYPDSFKIPMTSNLKKVKETGRTITQEASIVDVEGNELWYHSTLVPVYTDTRNLDYIMVVSLETTDRKKAEIDLAKKEAYNFAIFQNNPIATIIVDNNGKVIVSNLEQMNGNRHPAKGDIMYKDYGAHHQIDMYAEMIKIIKSGKKKTFPELKYKNKYLTISIAPFEHGAIITSQDITESKNTEKELQKLVSVVMHSSELINLANLDGSMIFLNDAGLGMLGIDKEEVENINIMQVIPENLQKKVQEELLPSIMQEGVWEGELQYINIRTGHLTDVYAITFSIKDPVTGEPLYLANISRDITERKKSEKELRMYRNQLEVIVSERTKELEEKNKKLDDAMKVFVGREMKINELENRIKLMGGKIE